ncbi:MULTISPECIES: chorismate synthase [unclassified Helicobacter]|uniref:chorismate synthase n=1 Tax=unclassified Helicobacter TaxID=2593540 RepID=UPI000CF0CD93|nr:MULTISPECIES: chorismate synthase [unclassified Helicobacter]
MNTFGQKLRVSTFGESHGKAIGCIIDGLPAGLYIDEERISNELHRRQGSKHFTTPRKELEKFEILSGVFDSYTTGAPVAILIYNQDAKSEDYSQLKDIFRPSHADWTYYKKYGIRDHRGGGRSSARESAARVCAGSIAKMLLEHFKIFVHSGVFAVGPISASQIDFCFARESKIFSLDKNVENRQKKLILQTKKNHDSIGGIALIQAYGKIPIGLGEGLYHKLDSQIGSLFMGLNGVKALEIGLGCKSSQISGSKNNDGMDENGFISNNHGGILGGMSSGEKIELKVHFKPTPSIFISQKTQNIYGNQVYLKLKGRHDPCIAIRGSVVCEHLLALILADMLLLNTTAKIEYLEKIYSP